MAARPLALALVATWTAACGPATGNPPSLMVLVLNKQGAYEARKVELKTLRDVVAVRGDVAELVGGARIIIDSSDPLLSTSLTDAQLAEVFVKAKGMEPRASYVEKEGLLWPADFHTWNMVTTYYNFERSFDYFQATYDGKATDELRKARVYYFPTFVLADESPNPAKDNALFFSPVQGFAILPFDKLQAVPLSINLGVVGHEFSHRVFNKRVYGGKGLPDPIVRWVGLTASSPPINLLKSMDEGLADFHAYGVTCSSELGCDPRYLASSLGTTEAAARDLSRSDLCLTEGLRNSLLTSSTAQFNQGLQYEVGSVIAGALYQAGNRTGKMQVLQKAVIASYSDTDTRKPGFAQLIAQNLETSQNFTLAAVTNALLTHITDPELKRQTCNEFLDRLQLSIDCPSLPCAAIPDCPASSVRGNACKPVNP